MMHSHWALPTVVIFLDWLLEALPNAIQSLNWLMYQVEAVELAQLLQKRYSNSTCIRKYEGVEARQC